MRYACRQVKVYTRLDIITCVHTHLNYFSLRHEYYSCDERLSKSLKLREELQNNVSLNICYLLTHSGAGNQKSFEVSGGITTDILLNVLLVLCKSEDYALCTCTL